MPRLQRIPDLRGTIKERQAMGLPGHNSVSHPVRAIARLSAGRARFL